MVEILGQLDEGLSVKIKCIKNTSTWEGETIYHKFHKEFFVLCDWCFVWNLGEYAHNFSVVACVKKSDILLH